MDLEELNESHAQVGTTWIKRTESNATLFIVGSAISQVCFAYVLRFSWITNKTALSHGGIDLSSQENLIFANHILFWKGRDSVGALYDMTNQITNSKEAIF